MEAGEFAAFAECSVCGESKSFDGGGYDKDGHHHGPFLEDAERAARRWAATHRAMHRAKGVE
jgi:hypothetical protein